MGGWGALSSVPKCKVPVANNKNLPSFNILLGLEDVISFFKLYLQRNGPTRVTPSQAWVKLLPLPHLNMLRISVAISFTCPELLREIFLCSVRRREANDTLMPGSIAARQPQAGLPRRKVSPTELTGVSPVQVCICEKCNNDDSLFI